MTLTLKAFVLLPVLFISVFALAQPMVQDREGLFSASGKASLDSMLQEYLKKSGIYVLVVSDSADVSNEGYTEAFMGEYGIKAKGKKMALALKMSRRHGSVTVSVNKALKQHMSEQQVTEILNAGVPSLQEKNPEQAARLICEKAMAVLSQLSGGK
jgi:uncharacterized membrane protein YgcG